MKEVLLHNGLGIGEEADFEAPTSRQVLSPVDCQTIYFAITALNKFIK